jgi:hypothetical protein
MTWLIIAEIATTAVVSLLFSLIYGLRSNWKATPIGQHLMWFGIATGVEGIALVFLAVGLPIPLWVFALVYGAVAGVAIQRLYLLLTVQKRSGQ